MTTATFTDRTSFKTPASDGGRVTSSGSRTRNGSFAVRLISFCFLITLCSEGVLGYDCPFTLRYEEDADEVLSRYGVFLNGDLLGFYYPRSYDHGLKRLPVRDGETLSRTEFTKRCRGELTEAKQNAEADVIKQHAQRTRELQFNAARQRRNSTSRTAGHPSIAETPAAQNTAEAVAVPSTPAAVIPSTPAADAARRSSHTEGTPASTNPFAGRRQQIGYKSAIYRQTNKPREAANANESKTRAPRQSGLPPASSGQHLAESNELLKQGVDELMRLLEGSGIGDTAPTRGLQHPRSLASHVNNSAPPPPHRTSSVRRTHHRKAALPKSDLTASERLLGHKQKNQVRVASSSGNQPQLSATERLNPSTKQPEAVDIDGRRADYKTAEDALLESIRELDALSDEGA
eukprot:Lankesteria_metandrocarpae@DN3324_c0_g1_i2.p1